MKLIKLELEPITELKKEYPNLYFTIKHYLPELNELQCAKVLSIAKNLCRSCSDESRDCQCWNDE